MAIKNTLNNKRKAVIVILAVLAAFCFFCTALTKIGSAGELNVDNVEVKEFYNLGDQITLADATFIDGGQDYTVTPTVIYPDGTAMCKNSFDLDQLGKYSVVYEKESDGVIYREDFEFNVYNYLLYNSTSGETFRYGSDVRDNGTEDHYGLRFDLGQGESLIYDKVIDLKDYDKEDTLIRFEAVPLVGSVRDATTVYVLLTDAHDPTNVVKIRIIRAPDAPKPNGETNNASYVQARFGDHAFGARSSQYGVQFRNGLLERTTTSVQVPIELRIDYANRQVYTYNSSTGSEGGLKMVTDLVKEFGNDPWQGFTTGECRISLYADGYVSTDVSNPFHGLLMAIDNQDLTGKEQDTFSTHIVETVAKREIQFGEYGSYRNVPKAVVGYSYKIFDAEYKSIYGGEKLYTNVYYAYNTSSMVEVPSNNGYFIPDRVGVYTIVYTVVDVFGNSAQTLLDITAIADNGYGIFVKVPDYENFISGNVGERALLVDASLVETENNYGSVEVVITATHPDGTRVNVTENNFLPQKGGLWKIVYTVKDHAGRIGKFSYDFNVIVSDKVIFGDIKDFNKYAIVNAENPVPTIDYIDYNVSPELKTVREIYFEKDGVKVADITNGYFKPTEAGAYNIVYKAVSSKGIANEKRVPVQAVDVGFGGNASTWDLSKYFYSKDGDVVSASTQSDGTLFTLKENGSADFIRPVDAVSFDLRFTVKNAAASKVSVILTDITNENQTVKFTFVNVLGVARLYINDRKEVVLNSQNFSDMKYLLNFESGIVAVGGVQVPVSDYLNGAEYNGFGSLLANLTFEVENDLGISGNTSILIDEINAQPFVAAGPNDNVDVIIPRIVSSRTFTNRIAVGTTVVIPYCKVIDVLTPKSFATLTIMAPSGKPAKGVDGKPIENVSITEDIELKLSEVGYYQLYYAYGDDSGCVDDGMFAYSVILSSSKDKPNIKVSGGDRTSSVNKYFKVGSAKVSGKFTECQLYIFVLAPSGNLKAIEIEDNGEVDYMKFYATEKGKHKVLYLAIDEWENMATVEYYVTVS